MHVPLIARPRRPSWIIDTEYGAAQMLAWAATVVIVGTVAAVLAFTGVPDFVKVNETTAEDIIFALCFILPVILPVVFSFFVPGRTDPRRFL